jgi:hypothetical protein
MPWRFDPYSIDIVFIQSISEIVQSGEIDFGSELSDLSIDTGLRDNDSSVLDQGLRVIDGSI